MKPYELFVNSGSHKSNGQVGLCPKRVCVYVIYLFHKILNENCKVSVCMSPHVYG